MPVLQMRKLRSHLSQDILTWRQGGMDFLGQTVFSQPGGPAPCLPSCSGTAEWQRPHSEGAAGFYSRVRLACLQGLSQLPGTSRADCLPPPQEGSLLSGLISCQLSCFLSCFCCSLRQTDRWGAQRTGLPEQGLPRAGDLCFGPHSLWVSTSAQAFPVSCSQALS